MKFQVLFTIIKINIIFIKKFSYIKMKKIMKKRKVYGKLYFCKRKQKNIKKNTNDSYLIKKEIKSLSSLSSKYLKEKVNTKIKIITKFYTKLFKIQTTEEFWIISIDKIIKCQKCPKIFYNERNLKNHESSVHQSKDSKVCKFWWELNKNIARQEKICNLRPLEFIDIFKKKKYMKNILSRELRKTNRWFLIISSKEELIKLPSNYFFTTGEILYFPEYKIGNGSYCSVFYRTNKEKFIELAVKAGEGNENKFIKAEEAWLDNAKYFLGFALNLKINSYFRFFSDLI